MSLENKTLWKVNDKLLLTFNYESISNIWSI